MTSRLRSVPRQPRFTVAVATAIAAALIAPATVSAAVTVGQTAPVAPEDVGLTTLWVQAASGESYLRDSRRGRDHLLVCDGRVGPGPDEAEGGPENPAQRVRDRSARTRSTSSPQGSSTRSMLESLSRVESCSRSGWTGLDRARSRRAIRATSWNSAWVDSVEPAVGQDFLTEANASIERVNVSATLEPDCDKDGFGDETQDTDTLSCNPDRSLSLDTNKGKVEKGRKVDGSARSTRRWPRRRVSRIRPSSCRRRRRTPPPAPSRPSGRCRPMRRATS